MYVVALTLNKKEGIREEIFYSSHLIPIFQLLDRNSINI